MQADQVHQLDYTLGDTIERLNQSLERTTKMDRTQNLVSFSPCVQSPDDDSRRHELDFSPILEDGGHLTTEHMVEEAEILNAQTANTNKFNTTNSIREYQSKDSLSP